MARRFFLDFQGSIWYIEITKAQSDCKSTQYTALCLNRPESCVRPGSSSLTATPDADNHLIMRKEEILMKKKNWLTALLAGAMVLSLAACGSGDNGGSTPATDNGTPAADTGTPAADAGNSTADEPFEISMVLKTNSAEFWQLVQAGAEAYEKEHPDLVKLSIKGPPSESSYDEQLNMVSTDLTVESFDGYLIAPLQSEAIATQIANTDKPVIAFDTRIESDKVVSFVGTGNREAAKQGAIAAVEAAKAAGWTDIKCIEIAGVQGDATNTARMEGFREGVNESGGEFLDAEVQYANAVADQAVVCMEAIMSKYPDGVAIICTNNDDMAIAAARTAAANPNYSNTIFLGFDGQISACEAVVSGELTMTAAQNNFDIGYKAVETMVQYLQGEKVEEFVDTGTEIITKENAQARIDRMSSYMK